MLSELQELRDEIVRAASLSQAKRARLQRERTEERQLRMAAEARNEQLSAEIPAATRPLLRQIESLRNAHAQSGGKLTRDALVAGLQSVNGQVGGFQVAFSGADHEGSRFVEMSMLTGDGRVRT